jgi:hypothetical protein
VVCAAAAGFPGNGPEQSGLPNGGALSVEHDGGEHFDGRAGELLGLESPLRHGRHRLFVESNGSLPQLAGETAAARSRPSWKIPYQIHPIAVSANGCGRQPMIARPVRQG